MKNLFKILMVVGCMLLVLAIGYGIGARDTMDSMSKEHEAEMAELKSDCDALLIELEDQLLEYEAEADELGRELTNMYNGKEFKANWFYGNTRYYYEQEGTGLFKSISKSSYSYSY